MNRICQYSNTAIRPIARRVSLLAGFNQAVTMYDKPTHCDTIAHDDGTSHRHCCTNDRVYYDVVFKENLCCYNRLSEINGISCCRPEDQGNTVGG